MEPILIVVDPAFVESRLEHEEDPLGSLTAQAPGLQLVFVRSEPLERHISTDEAPGALGYYVGHTKKPLETPRAAEAVGRERELLEAAEDAGRDLPRLEALIELAETLAASYVLTDDQELVYQPYEGGRFLDRWELVERLGETAAAADGELTGHDVDDDWMRHRLGRGMAAVEVYRAANEVQAKLLTGLLRREDIPYYLLSNYVACFDGIFAAAKGYWGAIHVLAEDEERARALIEGYIAAQPDWEEVAEETD